ncbi:MAG TPA: glycoside hydrolase family 44 protein [Vicinamibacteria bacterium]|nr:glycoside hydrolase family 44 protein [Vicinamibacteria bacterium]
MPSRRRRLALVVLVVLAAAPVCRSRRAGAASSPQPTAGQPEKLTVVQKVFDTASGLGAGWDYWGWAPSQHGRGAPARVRFVDYGGWILAHPGLEGEMGGLLFRMQAPASFGTFLEIALDSEHSRFPHVALEPRHLRAQDGGWSEYFLGMTELNPEGQPFDRVVFRATRQVSAEDVQFASIGFTREGGPPPTVAAEAPIRKAQFTVSCDATAAPINPMIYGIAWMPGKNPRDRSQWALSPGARRWGGNPASRYNWEIGNAWNQASDWFFSNVNYGGSSEWSYASFLADNATHGVKTAFTVSTLGWVAKDTRSYSFPVSAFGAQQQVSPENPDAGNGLNPAGKEIPPGPNTRTSVESSPESIGRLVRTIRERDGGRGRSVDQYILDNEPMLWNSTHRDVHPDPVTYDELLDRTIRYGTAVREADPQAKIAGPALWGWPAYFYSAEDAKWGFTVAPDRLRHGNVPLLPWWLRKLKEHEQRTGVHIVDVVDVHFYPHAKGVGGGEEGSTDSLTSALRIRSTRALWDPSYKDESWISDTVMLIPRLRQWIAENNPGLGISIGEWNFGAEKHQSGGLAAAEALGRFGALGVTSAYYWTYPAERSPAFWAFQAYRNFDGKGARFQDRSLPTTGQADLASLFASRDEAGERMVAVLLNHDPKSALEARLDLGTCGAIVEQRAFVYAGGKDGFAPTPSAPPDGTTLVHRAPPYSITVVDLKTRPAVKP